MRARPALVERWPLAPRQISLGVFLEAFHGRNGHRHFHGW